MRTLFIHGTAQRRVNIHQFQLSPAKKDTCPDSNQSQFDFKLCMDLVYHDGKGNNTALVYEGAISNSPTYTIRWEDGTKLYVHDRNLQLLNQPYFSNIPKTPLDYRKKFGTGLSLEEVQALARPSTLSPLQRKLTSWYHRIYHLTFCILFFLSSIVFLPKKFSNAEKSAAFYYM